MLPTYEMVAEALRQDGWTPLPDPQKRPTRKGLGRYAARSVLSSDPLRLARWPRWHKLWFAARYTQFMFEEQLDIRLPSTTFSTWRLRVKLQLEDPDDRRDELAEKAYRWATR
jgi:hypothetical protein